MRKILLFIVLMTAVCSNAADRFVSFVRTSSDQILLQQGNDTITYSDNDWEGVKIAVRNLRNDLKAVTGNGNADVIVATVGKSPIADRYKKYAKQLKGKWEQYIITTDNGKVVILGSDKRGTIYGIYELSRQIGVSPWYWMADAPIQHHDSLYIKNGIYTDGEPKVKYRGIFINDEWPSFGTWCSKQFGGVNHKAYARIFELLLRLKANYFWPAMWASKFNEDDPLNPKMADQMGIVMGTSHHEPMMRAHKEYTTRRDSVGPWDYSKNPERLDKFFREGIEHSKAYENIITIGMRGDGDVAMGNGNDAENMKTLSKVIDSQRKIIKDVYNKRTPIPQLWAIFTEVQRYYDAGFRVPDDVTLLFCDNNWGYIRRIGRDFERKRSGGLGLYYHIDMNGGPWNDRWVNTTTLPKIREQLHLAYATGMDRIWIINVGDLKPKEVPIDFIMNYAWNPDKIQPGDEQKYLEDFTRSIFGGTSGSVSDSSAVRRSRDIADIIAKYSKYNLWRKAEVQYPGIFNKEEMLRTNALWQNLVTRCENLRAVLPPEQQDAFYQLVYYPAVASAGVAQMYNYATMAITDQSHATEDSLAIEALMQKDKRLSDYYNNELAGGKWNGMMLDNHIGYTQWSIPDKNRNPMTLGFKVYNKIESTPTTEYSIPAYEYTDKCDSKTLRSSREGESSKGAKWIFLPDLGRGRGCMGIDNVMAESDTIGNGPALEYTVSFDSISMEKGKGEVAIGILPTQDVYPERGLRLGVQIDDEPMQIIDARRGLVDSFGEYTQKNLAVSKVLRPLPANGKLSLNGFVNGRQLPRRNEIFDNIRWLPVSFENIRKASSHTLRIFMVDPEVVVEQIVVNPDNNHYSYFGN